MAAADTTVTTTEKPDTDGTITDQRKYDGAWSAGVTAAGKVIEAFGKTSDALRALAVALIDTRESITFKGRPDYAGDSQLYRSAASGILREAVKASGLDPDKAEGDALRKRISNSVRQYTGAEAKRRIVALNEGDTRKANAALRSYDFKTDTDEKNAEKKRDARIQERKDQAKLLKEQEQAVKLLGTVLDPDTEKKPAVANESIVAVSLRILTLAGNTESEASDVPNLVSTLSAYLVAESDTLGKVEAANLNEARGALSRAAEAIASALATIDEMPGMTPAEVTEAVSA